VRIVIDEEELCNLELSLIPKLPMSMPFLYQRSCKFYADGYFEVPLTEWSLQWRILNDDNDEMYIQVCVCVCVCVLCACACVMFLQIRTVDRI
jgi:hypothetical protein